MKHNKDKGQSTAGLILAGVAAIALVTAITVVGWQVGWWLDAKNAEKSAEVRDNAPNAQRGYRQAARDAIEIVLDPNSSAALVSYNTEIACENIASVDPAYMTSDLDSFQATYC